MCAIKATAYATHLYGKNWMKKTGEKNKEEKETEDERMKVKKEEMQEKEEEEEGEGKEEEKEKKKKENVGQRICDRTSQYSRNGWKWKDGI